MRKSRIAINIIFLLSACITPYDTTNIFQEALVVEGLITDQPGPYVVNIAKSKSLSFDSQFDEPVIVPGAVVVIEDDIGNSEELKEKSPGSYQTTSFQGVIGRSYSIRITTSEGSTYQSAPEKLESVGDFENLRYEFVQNETPPPIFVSFALGAPHDIHSTNGFNIYIDSKVLPEQSGRVWWRWAGTFKIFTHPELQIEAIGVPLGEPVIVPAAPPCSGYVVTNPHTVFASIRGPVGPCTCCTCWITEYNTNPIISDPNFIGSEGQINNYKVAFIEANRRTFYEKYYLEVQQLSVSSTMYNFWKRVLVQKGNSGNLFQIPPPKITGNIKPISSGSIPVIGYFAAASMRTHGITIQRSDIPYDVGFIDEIDVSCLKTYQCCFVHKNSTTVKPFFW